LDTIRYVQMLFLSAPARDGFARFVFSCSSSRPVENDQGHMKMTLCMHVRMNGGT